MKYEPKSNEEAAYKCGLNLEVPMPQIILSESMLEAWKHGMDDREKLIDQKRKTTLLQLAKNDPLSTYWIVLFLLMLCCLVAGVTAYCIIKLMESI